MTTTTRFVLAVAAALPLLLLGRRTLGAPAAAASTAPPPPESVASAQPKVGNPGVELTELDRYVAQPDASFVWKTVSRRETDDGVELVIDLTSQTWRAPVEVDRTLWQHWLAIAAPESARSDVALLLIGGGTNDDDAPAGPSERAWQIARQTKSIVAEVGMIPNQPLEISGDGRPRVEDDLIARTWVESIRTADPTWPLQLPMTKAAVRAMDAVQQAVARERLPLVRRFVVAGGSKRGWTSWLAAAVDKRVVGVAPIVIDLLNIPASMKNHRAAYGFWAPALSDYQDQGLANFFESPIAAPLYNMVDPYAYRDRLTMPKCIINASGDEYFTPDSSQFYFDDLPGEKLLCYLPNTNHSLGKTNALDTLIAFHASIVSKLPRPKVAWTLSPDGAWQVTCDPTPKAATLWHAANPNGRDFRYATLGAAFASEPLSPESPGRFTANVATPSQGYAAYFVQLEFDVGAPAPLRISTPVHIKPETLPFADK